MSESNQEIFDIMKNIAAGKTTGSKLMYDRKSRKLKRLEPNQKNDPDVLSEIDQTDVTVFLKRV